MVARFLVDGLALVALIYTIFVSRKKVTRRAIPGLALAFAGPLASYLLAAGAGYREQISLDLAYAAVVAATLIHTAGRPWLVLPESYRQPSANEGTGHRPWGLATMVLALLLYGALEYFVGNGLL